jgi:hypothetical protein
LGLRPIYHRTEARVDGHLFISEAVNKSTFGPGWRGENAARDKATQVDLIEERRAPNGRVFGGKQRISLNQCVIMTLRFR